MMLLDVEKKDFNVMFFILGCILEFSAVSVFYNEFSSDVSWMDEVITGKSIYYKYFFWSAVAFALFDGIHYMNKSVQMRRIFMTDELINDSGKEVKAQDIDDIVLDENPIGRATLFIWSNQKIKPSIKIHETFLNKAELTKIYKHLNQKSRNNPRYVDKYIK